MRFRTGMRSGLAGVTLASMLAGCGLIPNSLRTYEQNGPSMAPAIQIGDVINRAGVGTPYRGEIVLINSSVDPYVQDKGLLIKRIVGLPGEKIEADNGTVMINGRRLNESYLAPGTQTEHLELMTVPAGQYYVLGDNRDSSSDSRFFGPIARKDLVGSSNRIVRPSKHAGRIRGT